MAGGWKLYLCSMYFSLLICTIAFFFPYSFLKSCTAKCKWEMSKHRAYSVLHQRPASSLTQPTQSLGAIFKVFSFIGSYHKTAQF